VGPVNLLARLRTAAPEEVKDFLELIGTPAYLYDVAPDGYRLIAMNARTESYTGVSSQNAPGSTLETIFGHEAARTIRLRWDGVVRSGQPDEYEGGWTPPGGRRFGRVRVTPLLDDEGKVVRLFGVAVDVTELVEARERLQEALVQVIEGFIPICAHCKSIRDEKDRWVPVERFVEDRSAAMFSHGVCPSCAMEHYGEFLGPHEDPIL
jgi:PAS domain S-box-containing protein